MEAETAAAPFERASMLDLPAFGIGHATDAVHATGCTVVVAPNGATCGVDVRGGGPATRETDLLKPENMVERAHAVVLAGGSAFGLEASCGVMEALAERGIGFPVGEARVPIVVGACLFDLAVGDSGGAVPSHPDKAMGRSAAEEALGSNRGAPDGASAACGDEPTAHELGIAEGNVGAGAGATVGKLLGQERAMKTGIGAAFLRSGELVVGAIVAVNALGNVRDFDGSWIAGCRGEDGRVLDPLAALGGLECMPSASADRPCANTTIGVVLTNARITKAQATKCASTAHDAYARAIKPVHTLNDGDTVFCLASGEVDALPDAVSILATEAMQHAIVRAAATADPACGLPSARRRA